MGRLIRRKKSDNKKVKNATPIKVDDVQYRSKLEAYCASQLKESGIDFKYEAIRYDLIPKFEYKGEKIRACTYTPDFVGDNWIIDCKGWPTEVFKIKWKLFQKYILDRNLQLDLYLPSSQTKVREVIQQILKPIKTGDGLRKEISKTNTYAPTSLDITIKKSDLQ